ncbi:replication initiation factor domain-containing protein [Leptospira alstonii]|uniref:Replication initiation factor n=2 Tax=Leptospira alstonii TaxID=28452 RepID=M6CXR7_9LEPT|nr:replication initiation factor domain-containing protein [Leptospira alstonii]EMJ96682.1 replication initiation factor [Leptospira alstonii serovar Sichuan str. 79601]EQA78807.1 replication initiation factor [Leptospira alstonii serovar Pingchang str. 80-412]
MDSFDDYRFPEFSVFVPDELKLPFVDWLAFSIEYSDASWSWLKKVFGELRIEEKGTVTGHTHQFRGAGDVFGAFSPERRNQKIHIQLSSKALFNFKYSEYTLTDLIREAIGLKGKFTRIDLALDDYEGHLNLPLIYEKLERKETSTRFRGYSEYESPVDRIKSGSLFLDPKLGKLGHTIYIGAFRKSNCFVRVYDKRLQVGSECVWPIWNRLEFQLNHKAADQYCNPTWNVNPETGEITDSKHGFPDPRRATFEDRSFPKTAFYYLKFLEPAYTQKQDSSGFDYIEEIHKRYWPVCSWWTKFLNTCEGQGIGLPKHETGLQNIDDWLNEQVSGAIYLMSKLYGGENYFDKLQKKGEPKFERNKKYQNLVKEFEEKQKVRIDEVPF